MTRRLRELGSGMRDALLKAMEPVLYNAGIALYRRGVGVAALRNGKASLLAAGQKEVWRRLDEKIGDGGNWIWFHAASLGEFEQGRPLMERLRARHPGKKILLTFFSPSGYEVRKNYTGADCICYLPFDRPKSVRRFLDKVRPEMAVFIKYEIWRNYLSELSRRGIPAYLVSAVFREDQVFFKRLGAWYKDWLRWFRRIYVQDEGSLRLLESVGIGTGVVAGDTRFDRVADIRDSARRIPALDRFCGRRGEEGRPRFVLVAGSSWGADEDVYASWVNRHADVKCIVAPHEFDARRLERLKELFAGSVLLSEVEDNPEKAAGAKVLIIDCFGLLSSAYAYGDAAYVGGGFGVGIHNVNEAAAHGIPVVFGPNHKKFLEALDLITLGGGLTVSSREGFDHVADRLLIDVKEREKRGRWAGEYISEKTGAADRISADLFP